MLTRQPPRLRSVGAIPYPSSFGSSGFLWEVSPDTPLTRHGTLAPRIMHAILPIPGKGKSGWDYAWIPVLGPLAGTLIAAIIYMVV